MTAHFDTLETRDPELRERAMLARLPEQIAYAKARAPALAALLADVDPREITSRAALARLPVIRKSELLERQAAQRPFGGLNATGWGAIARVFGSAGPIYEPEGRARDYWRLARALYAAGFRAGDLVHNCFSYHFAPAGSMAETGAHALGCTVVPGGTGQTELQAQALADLGADGYVGTPSFLRLILEKADEMGLALPRLTKAMVSGEAFLSPVRELLRARGIDGYQAYATADLGLISYETIAHEGMVVDEGVLLEIVRPGTNEPVPEGEVGEVVVTSLANLDYPLIRFGTGDLSALLPGRSPCGRTNVRIKGWMGRADQTTKVKALFVHPEQVAQIVRRHPEIVRARLVVTNPDAQDRMTLHVEAREDALSDTAAVAATMREVTKLRGEVLVRARGELPNDGKVIEDLRRYD